MNEQEHRPDGTVPEASQLSAAEGESKVSDAPTEESISLSELTSVLGRNYSTKDELVKGLKETTSYVGRVGQLEEELRKLREQPQPVAPKAEEKPAGRKTMGEQIATLQRELFFTKHPDLVEHSDILDRMGEDPYEVIQTEEWKKIHAALTSGSAPDKKSVMPSSPHIAPPQTEDYKKEFELARTTGNWSPFLEKWKGFNPLKEEA